MTSETSLSLVTIHYVQNENFGFSSVDTYWLRVGVEGFPLISAAFAMGDRPVEQPPGIAWDSYSTEALLQVIATLVALVSSRVANSEVYAPPVSNWSAIGELSQCPGRIIPLLNLQGLLKLLLSLHLLLAMEFPSGSLRHVGSDADGVRSHVQGPHDINSTPAMPTDAKGKGLRERWKKFKKLGAGNASEDESPSAAPVDVADEDAMEDDAFNEWEFCSDDVEIVETAETAFLGCGLDIKEQSDGGSMQSDKGLLAGFAHGPEFRGSVPNLPPPKRSKYVVHDSSKGDVSGVPSSSSDMQRLSLPQHVISEAVRLTDTQQFKYPWEKGALGKFFDKKAEIVPDVKPRLQPGRGNFVKVQLDMDDSARATATMSVEPLETSCAIFAKVVKAMEGVSYLDERGARRDFAVRQWAELLSFNYMASGVGVTTHYECNDNNPLTYCCEMLGATFGLKSPNTLLKRLYGVRAYNEWLIHNGLGVWLPLTELSAWRYLCFLKESGASATKATSFLESVLSSGRIRGRASQLFASKRPWQPADPLTTQEVILLRQGMSDVNRSLIDRAILGHILHMLYSRSRFSDLLAVQDMSLDSEKAFLELHAALHKGSRGADSSQSSHLRLGSTGQIGLWSIWPSGSNVGCNGLVRSRCQ